MYIQPVLSNKYNNSNNNAAKSQNFSGIGDTVARFYAKYYAKPLYNSKFVQDLSVKAAKIPGTTTEHMSALGSAITSGTYIKKTLDNQDLDNKNKKTLAVNQFMCFVIPTVLSYWANSKLSSFTKKHEHDYSGLQESKKAAGKVPKEKLADFEKAIGNRLKGFKTLSALLTFTLIYRYATPVLVTPFANVIGRWMFGNKDKNNVEAAKSSEIKNNKSEKAA